MSRTKAAPAAGATPDRFRFVFASCQRWDQGFYTAYRDLAQQEPDLVLHLRNCIYELSTGRGDQLWPGDYSGHVLTTPKTLEDYRHRYALYNLESLVVEHGRARRWRRAARSERRGGE